MRLLVTGAAGFIGSNFVRYWLQQHPGDQVVAYDLLTYAGNRTSLADLEDEILFVEGDIGDLELAERTLRDERIEVVVNFAAESHNSLAVLDPARFFQTNVVGTGALCHAAVQAGVERFHHVSTCEVYGDLPLDTDEMFTEESPYRPRTPYNASKAGGDHVVRSYHETFGLPITITNCSNNYGPFQFPEKVIPVFTTNALDDIPIPMYASTQNKREWLHVLDHCTRDRPRDHERDAGCDLQRRLGRRGVDRGARRPAARADRQAAEPEDDRGRPPGARPPLPARLVEDPPRTGLGADHRLGAGPPRHGRVVPGEPRLVGAAQGARARLRDGLALISRRRRSACPTTASRRGRRTGRLEQG